MKTCTGSIDEDPGWEGIGDVLKPKLRKDVKDSLLKAKRDRIALEAAEKVRAKDERARERALKRDQEKGNKSKVTATKKKSKTKQVPSQPQKPVPDLRCFLLPQPTRRSTCLTKSMVWYVLNVLGSFFTSFETLLISSDVVKNCILYTEHNRTYIQLYTYTYIYIYNLVLFLCKNHEFQNFRSEVMASSSDLNRAALSSSGSDAGTPPPIFKAPLSN